MLLGSEFAQDKAFLDRVENRMKDKIKDPLVANSDCRVSWLILQCPARKFPRALPAVATDHGANVHRWHMP